MLVRILLIVLGTLLFLFVAGVVSALFLLAYVGHPDKETIASSEAKQLFANLNRQFYLYRDDYYFNDNLKARFGASVITQCPLDKTMHNRIYRHHGSGRTAVIKSAKSYSEQYERREFFVCVSDENGKVIFESVVPQREGIVSWSPDGKRFLLSAYDGFPEESFAYSAHDATNAPPFRWASSYELDIEELWFLFDYASKNLTQLIPADFTLGDGNATEWRMTYNDLEPLSKWNATGTEVNIGYIGSNELVSLEPETGKLNIRLSEIAVNDLSQSFKHPYPGAANLSYSPSGEKIAYFEDGMLQIKEVATDQVLHEFQPQFYRDGTSCVSWTNQETNSCSDFWSHWITWSPDERYLLVSEITYGSFSSGKYHALHLIDNENAKWHKIGIYDKPKSPYQWIRRPGK